MDGEQHVRSHANSDSDAYPNAHANAYPDTYPNANAYANANANANHVCAVGRRQDLHGWASGQLSWRYLQGAVDPHRLRRRQLESEGHPDLVGDRRNLRYDSYPDANTNTNTNADSNANTNTNTYTNADTDSDANRHEETSVSRLYACQLRKRLGLYPYG